MRDFQFHIRFGAIECNSVVRKRKKNERDKDKEEKYRKRMRNCGAWRTFRWSKYLELWNFGEWFTIPTPC